MSVGRKVMVISKNESRNVKSFKLRVARIYGLKVVNQDSGRKNNNHWDKKMNK